MTPTRRGLSATALGAPAPAACARTASIQGAGGESIGRGTPSRRADQIRRAGAGLGWRVEPRGPGLARGTPNLRTQRAVVGAPCDTQRFGIRYVSGSDLDRDGRATYRNHNGWAQNPRNAMVAQQPAAAA